MVGVNLGRMSKLTTSQPLASKALPIDPVPLKSQQRGHISLKRPAHLPVPAAVPPHQTKASAKTYVNMFEGPVTGNIPGQLALALTPYAQVADLAVNTAASGNNAAAIQSLDDRVTAELASKLDSSALAPAIAPLATAAALATTDGQVAAHGSSIAALQSSLTTGLSNKADQSAFDVLEGVVATKSTPDGVDLKLSNYSTTAAMNGSIASANNATLATAANYGLKTVVDQHSLDIAARITPLEVDTKVANAHRRGAGLRAREPRRLHLGAAGLQGRRQRPDCLRPAVGRGHFLGGGL